MRGWLDGWMDGLSMFELFVRYGQFSDVELAIRRG